MRVYLASKSPRRKELLAQMGVKFDLLLVDTPELLKPNETPEIYSQRVTQEKMDAAWDKMIEDGLPIQPILCADTEVVMNERILGKPCDYEDAFNMIKSYSGKTHRVLTSVGVTYFEYKKIMTDITYVTFAPMTDEDIHHYLSTDNYQDKSGAYGIQSYIGQFICRIEGCFYSVMGLPLHLVRQLLQDVNSH